MRRLAWRGLDTARIASRLRQFERRTIIARQRRSAARRVRRARAALIGTGLVHAAAHVTLTMAARILGPQRRHAMRKEALPLLREQPIALGHVGVALLEAG